MKILVSNLNFDATEQDIQQLFSAFGDIESVQLVRGWDDNESRGIAVVIINKRLNGEKAIKNLNRSLYMEQVLNINEIRSPYFQSETLLTRY